MIPFFNYQYFIGLFIPASVWFLIYFLRKDLRKLMLWGGGVYILILSIGFPVLFFLTSWGLIAEYRTITPGYWTPVTLFNLGALSYGYAIEDLLFMFFAGGIGATCYEFVFRRRGPHGRPSEKYTALCAGGAVAAIIIFFSSLNLIYALIGFGFGGAAALCIERRDLILHSLMSGLIFLGIYFFFFLAFIALFPHFVASFYHLEQVSGILFFGVPLEEFLYAFSFGSLWGPFYEYEHKKP